MEQRKRMRARLRRWGEFARFCTRRQEDIEEMEALIEDAVNLRAHVMTAAGGGLTDHTAAAAQRAMELRAIYEERIAAMVEEVARERAFALGMDELLAGLERVQREVIELRYRRGMTMRAIAERMQYSEKWAETLERRAVDGLCGMRPTDCPETVGIDN